MAAIQDLLLSLVDDSLGGDIKEQWFAPTAVLDSFFIGAQCGWNGCQSKKPR